MIHVFAVDDKIVGKCLAEAFRRRINRQRRFRDLPAFYDESTVIGRYGIVAARREGECWHILRPDMMPAEVVQSACGLLRENRMLRPRDARWTIRKTLRFSNDRFRKMMTK